MKRTLILSVAAAALILTAVYGQSSSSGKAKWEFAIIKYDGPDRIQFIRPDRFEFVRLFQSGVQLPKNAHDEEYCLAVAANQMAEEGWEVVNLDATRLMLRRQK